MRNVKIYRLTTKYVYQSRMFSVKRANIILIQNRVDSTDLIRSVEKYIISKLILQIFEFKTHYFQSSTGKLQFLMIIKCTHEILISVVISGSF